MPMKTKSSPTLRLRLEEFDLPARQKKMKYGARGHRQPLHGVRIKPPLEAITNAFPMILPTTG